MRLPWFAHELTQQESDEQAAKLGAMVDDAGLITHTGALMLPALGIYPINDNRAPADLGVEVQSIGGGRVVIMKVKPGSAAEKAGLKPIDFIVSVRPDRPVFFASEFERQVRFAGAGAQVEVTYQRGGQLETTNVTLDAAADADPWHEVSRYDLIGMLYQAAGDPSAADVIASMGIMSAMVEQKEQKAGFQAYTGLMRSLGMTADFQHLQEVGANSAPPYDDSYNFGLKLSQRLDSIFHFADNPLQKFYESAVQQSHDPGSGVSQVLNEFDVQLKPKIGELIDRLIFRPGVGFQIPPELLEEEYHIHPEMTPEYLGVPGDSQLARLMLTSDYLCKQLSNRQDLKSKISGYQTDIEYQINHPEVASRSNTAYRVWVSVGSVNAAQSTNGTTLALRGVRMRFNIRETDSQQHDLPNQQPGGYEDVLTGLYDPLEQEFPTLHELREAAKLAAVAVWMQKQDPAIRLPAEGRATWKGPEKVHGLVYIYLTVNQHHESKIIKIAEGGVSLVPFPAGNTAVVFPTDSSVVDLRGSSTMATIFTRPDTAAIRTEPVGTSAGGSSPFVAGWVASLAGGTPGQEAAVLTKADEQLKSAAATAAKNGDLRQNFDEGRANNAGSLIFPTADIDPTKFSDAVKKNPAMIEALSQLDHLQTARVQLGTELAQLTAARNAEKDSDIMNALTSKVDQKNKEYQASLLALTNKTEDVKKLYQKLHREIDISEGAPSVPTPDTDNQATTQGSK